MQINEAVRSHIREVPDFPIPGILFKDISPIFLNPQLTQDCAEHLSAHWQDHSIHKVVGIDSRGFLLGPQIAIGLDAGFVMVRKKGKLPPETVSVSYSLEYGTAEIESLTGSIVKGDRVLIHDDLLATGGTASGAAELVEKLGGTVIGFSFIINLSYLKGDEKLHPYSDKIHYLVNYTT
ncbi:MAG: adenine phosphoribosyltransferase [Bacteroidota bacterium]